MDPETTYLFSSQTEPGSPAAEWVAQADASELRGTLCQALALAEQLGCDVELRDEAGFRRGKVAADGTYQCS